MFLHPRAAFSKYVKRTYFKIIRAPAPYTDEDYNRHWAFTDFKGKTVLDLGADYGSTAWFFLNRGSKSLIAVEGDPERAQRLAKNAVKFGFSSYERMIISPGDLEEFLAMDNFDVAKVDIEGAEIHLLHVRDELITAIPFWMIESHSDELTIVLTKRFQQLGFSVREIHENNNLIVLIISKPRTPKAILNS